MTASLSLFPEALRFSNPSAAGGLLIGKEVLIIPKKLSLLEDMKVAEESSPATASLRLQ